MISILWVYDAKSDFHGIRLLVDRLWPRGISKERLKVDQWMREIAPSDTLRQWFSHDPAKWNEFKKKYFEDLDKNPETQKLLQICRENDVIFLFAAKDMMFNNAVALKEYVSKHT